MRSRLTYKIPQVFYQPSSGMIIERVKFLFLLLGCIGPQIWSSHLIKTTQTSPSTQALPNSNGPDRSQLTNHSDPLWALLGPLSKPLKCRTMTLFATSVQVSTTSLYL